MASQIENAQLVWGVGDLPRSAQFDDTYYSDANGLAETQFVYLGGNDLPRRFCDGFHIAELGFGTGLNLLAAWVAWEDVGMKTPLQFTSFEAFPLSQADMKRALLPWPELAEKAAILVETGGNIDHPTLQSRVILGDAVENVPQWAGAADAWFLDGFSPSKNPDMWREDLMLAVGAHTAPRGTFATFTSAGFVRQNLTNAGFDVNRVDGHGRKRHMSVGTLKD